MSRQKKPAARPPLTAAADSPPLDLTPAERSLLKSFRRMDDSAQGFIGRLADAQAERCPRRAAPSLRLVECDHAKG